MNQQPEDLDRVIEQLRKKGKKCLEILPVWNDLNYNIKNALVESWVSGYLEGFK